MASSAQERVLQEAAQLVNKLVAASSSVLNRSPEELAAASGGKVQARPVA